MYSGRADRCHSSLQPVSAILQLSSLYLFAFRAHEVLHVLQFTPTRAFRIFEPSNMVCDEMSIFATRTLYNHKTTLISQLRKLMRRSLSAIDNRAGES